MYNISLVQKKIQDLEEKLEKNRLPEGRLNVEQENLTLQKEIIFLEEKLLELQALTKFSDICKEECFEEFKQMVDGLNNINAQDSEGKTVLMHCLSHKFFQGVDYLLLQRSDLDCNILDAKGQNALIYACTFPHIKYIKLIAEKTTDINLQSADTHNTALYLATSYGNDVLFASEINANLVDSNDKGGLYLDEKLPEDYTNYKHTIGNNKSINGISFHGNFNAGILKNEHGEIYIKLGGFADSSAVTYAKTTNIVKFLLSKGANALLANKAGVYPIHKAALLGHTNVVKIFKDAGVDINLKMNNAPALTPLYLASENGHLATVEYLHFAGANINAQRADNDQSALWIAANQGKADIVEFLLKNGASNTPGNNGFFPIHRAALSGHTNIVEMFIKNNKDNVYLKMEGTIATTALYLASENGHLDTVKYLYSEGADINAQRADNDQSALWIAANQGNTKVVEFLLKKGALNTPDNTGNFPIHRAALNQHLGVLKVFVEKGIDINFKNTKEVTPLYSSLGYGKPEIDLEVVKFLLENNADVSIAMYDGDTPMHMAHYKGDKKAIDLLLSYGSDLNALNKDLKSPLQGLLEAKEISTDTKVKIIQNYRNKYDLELKNSDGKTVLEYSEEHCPELVSAFTTDLENSQELTASKFEVLTTNQDAAKQLLNIIKNHENGQTQDHLPSSILTDKKIRDYAQKLQLTQEQSVNLTKIQQGTLNTEEQAALLTQINEKLSTIELATVEMGERLKRLELNEAAAKALVVRLEEQLAKQLELITSKDIPKSESDIINKNPYTKAFYHTIQHELNVNYLASNIICTDLLETSKKGALGYVGNALKIVGKSTGVAGLGIQLLGELASLTDQSEQNSKIKLFAKITKNTEQMKIIAHDTAIILLKTDLDYSALNNSIVDHTKSILSLSSKSDVDSSNEFTGPKKFKKTRSSMVEEAASEIALIEKRLEQQKELGEKHAYKISSIIREGVFSETIINISGNHEAVTLQMTRHIFKKLHLSKEVINNLFKTVYLENDETVATEFSTTNDNRAAEQDEVPTMNKPLDDSGNGRENLLDGAGGGGMTIMEMANEAERTQALKCKAGDKDDTSIAYPLQNMPLNCDRAAEQGETVSVHTAGGCLEVDQDYS